MQYPPLFSFTSSPVEIKCPLPAEGVCHAVSVPSCRGAHLKDGAHLSQGLGVCSANRMWCSPPKSWTASELCLNVGSQKPRGPLKDGGSFLN